MDSLILTIWCYLFMRLSTTNQSKHNSRKVIFTGDTEFTKQQRLHFTLRQFMKNLVNVAMHLQKFNEQLYDKPCFYIQIENSPN